MSISTGAAIIAGVSLALLIAWDKFSGKSRFLQLVPGPLVVVTLGIALNQAFAAWAPSLQLVDPEHLVNLPGGRQLPASSSGSSLYPISLL